MGEEKQQINNSGGGSLAALKSIKGPKEDVSTEVDNVVVGKKTNGDDDTEMKESSATSSPPAAASSASTSSANQNQNQGGGGKRLKLGLGGGKNLDLGLGGGGGKNLSLGLSGSGGGGKSLNLTGNGGDMSATIAEMKAEAQQVLMKENGGVENVPDGVTEEILEGLSEYHPLVPLPVCRHYLLNGGCKAESDDVTKIFSLAAQSLLHDIVHEAKNSYALRRQAEMMGRRGNSVVSITKSKATLTVQDLASGLEEKNIEIRKPTYFAS